MRGLLVRTAFDVVTKALQFLEDRGVEERHIERIIANEAYADSIAEAMVYGALEGESYPITVNYELTFHQMVSAGGYDWINKSINYRKFQAELEGKHGKVSTRAWIVVMKLWNYNVVLKDLDKIGLRPASAAELLAFGARYREVENCRVFGLGSRSRSDDGDLNVFVIEFGRGKRYLNLRETNFGPSTGRFNYLALPKRQVTMQCTREGQDSEES